MMLALFGLIACVHFDASAAWWLLGFICLLMDAESRRR